MLIDLMVWNKISDDIYQQLLVSVFMQCDSGDHFSSTVKPVYKDHPRDQQTVVLVHVVHRWSLYTWKIYLKM